MTGPGTNPGIFGGADATGYETLDNLGRAHPSPGVLVDIPISRTGELRFEYTRTLGEANQYAPAATTIYGTAINQGDYLATAYTIQRAKLYLDDLMFPHKFPVAKFRLKSLWEVQWVHMGTSVDAPYVDATGNAETATGTEQLILPAFGIAAEYAITRHLLFRADVSGFGIPHRSDVADTDVLLAYRKGAWEVKGGLKAFHFKTSPNSASGEYVSATEAGPFLSLLWHWSL